MAIRLIVLAAGKGTRMKSTLPKVLHSLAGKPLLAHVLDTTAELHPVGTTVVIGHGAELVQQTIAHPVNWAVQAEQLGTAHAVQQGLENIADDDTVLITYGDVPLTRASTYRQLVGLAGAEQIALLTLVMQDASGYGRVIRNSNNQVTGIVEQKDASAEQLSITEMNAGVLALRGKWLRRFLDEIGNDNAQGEFYLTDIFALAVAAGLTIETCHPDDAWEVDGVNSRVQLAALERQYQRNQALALMESGVTLRDPERLDVRGSLQTGTDVEIDVNCVFVGECVIGNKVSIGPNCQLIDSHIADGTVVLANSVIESARIGEACSIGPFARLRPGTELSRGVRIGNFVETKNSVIADGSKVNHLSYVGDSDVGHNVNIGAGTITANYDGVNKHRTAIEDNVNIGSNTVLVAPVTVHEGATIGAGSTISKNAAANHLTFTRARLTVIEGWLRPAKKR
jgi:bifunctional UDP-N-acetylglucosamine pyrophosphorylase/glucosamine-1-phosphate N-acetyltransferase